MNDLAIKKEIISLLKKNKKSLPESILILTHLLYCTSLACKIDPKELIYTLEKIEKSDLLYN